MISMTRMTILSLVVVVAMALTPVPARAQGQGGATAPPATGVQQPIPSGTNVNPPASGSDTSHSGTGSPSASVSSSDFRGVHTMTGEVTKIDHAKGTFSVKTPETTLDLHAPPSALSGINTGDQVAVEIGVKPMK